jgi:hypothetical protein
MQHLSTGSFASGAQPDFDPVWLSLLALNTNTHVNPLQSEGLGEKHTLVCDVSAAAGGAPAAAAPNPGENMVAWCPRASEVLTARESCAALARCEIN